MDPSDDLEARPTWDHPRLQAPSSDCVKQQLVYSSLWFCEIFLVDFLD